MPYICAKSNNPKGYPFTAFNMAGHGAHRDLSGQECRCAGVWISESEYDRRYNITMNRVLGFSEDYQGSRYQGYKWELYL